MRVRCSYFEREKIKILWYNYIIWGNDSEETEITAEEKQSAE